MLYYMYNIKKIKQDKKDKKIKDKIIINIKENKDGYLEIIKNKTKKKKNINNIFIINQKTR